MKKILFVVDEKQIGGVNIVLEDYLNILKFEKSKIDVLVLHNNGDRFANLPSNVNIIYGDPYFDIVDISLKELVKTFNLKGIIDKLKYIFLMKTGKIGKYIVKTREKLNLESYDIEVAFKDGFCTLFTGYGGSIKKIAWIHTDFDTNNRTEKYKKTFEKCFKTFDKIVGVSEKVTEAFVREYGLEERSITINNYVNTEKIIKMANKEGNFELDKDKFNFVTLGRLCNDKGYDRLINAFDSLNKENLLADVHLNIIGDGEEYESLKNMIAKNNLDKYITLRGKINEPYSDIKKHDMFILTSRSESYALVLIEALILGVPVITTEIASIKDIITNNNHAIVVENSEDGIYEGIKDILKNKNKTKYMKDILMDYSYNSVNDKIIKQMKELLGE